MIDSIMNLLFRCPHQRLTRPIAPVTKAGTPHSQSYVVCLDCGKQFEYDTNQMRIGKPIDHSHEHGVVPPPVPTSNKKKVAYGLMAAIPAAVLLGSAWKRRKKGADRNGDESAEGGKARGAAG
jgi:hypothetical protein